MKLAHTSGVHTTAEAERARSARFLSRRRLIATMACLESRCAAFENLPRPLRHIWVLKATTRQHRSLM